MIVTEQKPFDEIKKNLIGLSNIFIIGCGECATSCQTGGEKEVEEMAELLSKEGKNIVGKIVIESPCDKRLVQKYFKIHQEAIKNADALLIMACGAGAGAIRDLTDKKIVPALNGLYLGTTERLNNFKEYCKLCKICILGITDGYCPTSRCAKGLLNGPCGGSVNGKCEKDLTSDCVWALIIKRLKEKNELEKLFEIKEPRNYSRLIKEKN
ncbi:MAG TPA: methylenetetrahydrofolate reductase C-terminal domain-containing protein [bacterium]|nr:methylenetetrahydrofolate reductase C-terminal domain-containing protein [bacterium]HOL48186.1 methylenetetrahydrofolate reductase C-terminal domain-containing protein [bacterium]HPQ19491.1 methylenetetrahydrofolate reductase C-terminal domain-containing protein [bacterium]